MATLRQKKVARLIVENAILDKPLNGGEILEKTGYAPGVIKNPKDILDSIGVQEELENLGFTTEGADSVVQKILYKGKREETKLKAADMVYKRLGSYKDTEQGAGKTLIINISGETANRYGLTDTKE